MRDAANIWWLCTALFQPTTLIRVDCDPQRKKRNLSIKQLKSVLSQYIIYSHQQLFGACNSCCYTVYITCTPLTRVINDAVCHHNCPLLFLRLCSYVAPVHEISRAAYMLHVLRPVVDGVFAALGPLSSAPINAVCCATSHYQRLDSCVTC
jgi:hypothetical protein